MSSCMHGSRVSELRSLWPRQQGGERRCQSRRSDDVAPYAEGHAADCAASLTLDDFGGRSELRWRLENGSVPARFLGDVGPEPNPGGPIGPPGRLLRPGSRRPR